jgi:hypothetical protein
MQVRLPEQVPHHQDLALVLAMEAGPVVGQVAADPSGVGAAAGLHRVWWRRGRHRVNLGAQAPRAV